MESRPLCEVVILPSWLVALRVSLIARQLINVPITNSEHLAAPRSLSEQVGNIKHGVNLCVTMRVVHTNNVDIQKSTCAYILTEEVQGTASTSPLNASN